MWRWNLVFLYFCQGGKVRREEGLQPKFTLLYHMAHLMNQFHMHLHLPITILCLSGENIYDAFSDFSNTMRHVSNHIWVLRLSLRCQVAAQMVGVDSEGPLGLMQWRFDHLDTLCQ
jgi:hypothetical protein